MSTRINPSSVFIIIPAYNEHTVIQTVVKQITNLSYSVVVIDDGSNESLSSAFKNISVYFLRHRINLGQGAALQTGIEFAVKKNASYIITFDGDGQHEPDDIGKLISILDRSSSDIVFGSRFLKGAVHNMPIKRKIVLQAARYINYIFTGILLSDAHNGFRAMNKKAAAAIQLKENRMAHATEILYQVRKNKLKYAEVPVTVSYTPYSLKKGQTTKNSFRILLDIILSKLFK
jgi:polyprenyl-phospho-N-acetylgalactosaminyl synthase